MRDHARILVPCELTHACRIAEPTLHRYEESFSHLLRELSRGVIGNFHLSLLARLFVVLAIKTSEANRGAYLTVMTQSCGPSSRLEGVC